LVLSLGF